jgi:hypothetical protein
LGGEVAVCATEDVVGAEGGDQTDHGGFLADTGVDRSSETSASVHVVKSGFQGPPQDHELVELEKAIPVQLIGRT